MAREDVNGRGVLRCVAMWRAEVEREKGVVDGRVVFCFAFRWRGVLLLLLWFACGEGLGGIFGEVDLVAVSETTRT